MYSTEEEEQEEKEEREKNWRLVIGRARSGNRSGSRKRRRVGAGRGGGGSKILHMYGYNIPHIPYSHNRELTYSVDNQILRFPKALRRRERKNVPC